MTSSLVAALSLYVLFYDGCHPFPGKRVQRGKENIVSAYKSNCTAARQRGPRYGGIEKNGYTAHESSTLGAYDSRTNVVTSTSFEQSVKNVQFTSTCVGLKTFAKTLRHTLPALLPLPTPGAAVQLSHCAGLAPLATNRSTLQSVRV